MAFEGKGGTLRALSSFRLQFSIPKFVVVEGSSVSEILSKLPQVIKDLGCEYLAVRSCSDSEDRLQKSGAGQFDSVLNVSATFENLSQAVCKVIESYDCLNLAQPLTVIIQEMVKNCELSGVVFSRDLASGAPYLCINYDDVTGFTDSVTSGTGEHSNKTLYVFRNEWQKLQSPRFKIICAAVSELMEYFDGFDLDIEFALTKKLEPLLLQVRPVTAQAHNVDENVFKMGLSRVTNEYRATKSQIKLESLEDKLLLSQMTDWNPAEMIGGSPPNLAFDLYSKLITDRNWSAGRQKLGYSAPIRQKLMYSIGGKPYIDVASSLSSFLVCGIHQTIREALLADWIERVRLNKALHDKVESEVAITTYTPSLAKEIDQRCSSLSTAQKDDFYQALRKQFSIFYQSELVENLRNYFDRYVENCRSFDDSLSITSQVKIEKYVGECAENFSTAARLGFIGKALLDSLQNEGFLSENETSEFMASLYLPSQAIMRASRTLNDKSARQNFLEKYGHLRPGTYGITIPNYKNDPHIFSKLTAGHKVEVQDKFDLSRFRTTSCDSFNMEGMLHFIKQCIELREWGKFSYASGVNYLIEDIVGLGKNLDIDLLTLENLDLQQIDQLRLGKITRNEAVELAQENRETIALYRSIRMPEVLDESFVAYIVPFTASSPNFISSDCVSGQVALLEPNSTQVDLDGCIVCVENADPGYDWIFSHEIRGLITKYGGANSHMAIRCAELGVPAAIGCGEQLFGKIFNKKVATIDCLQKKIVGGD